MRFCIPLQPRQIIPLDISLRHLTRCACSSTPLPCPAALLKPPCTYLAIPQWPEVEHLILRTFTPDMLLRITGESRHSQENCWQRQAGERNIPREKPGPQGHRAC